MCFYYFVLRAASGGIRASFSKSITYTGGRDGSNHILDGDRNIEASRTIWKSQRMVSNVSTIDANKSQFDNRWNIKDIARCQPIDRLFL